MEKEGVLVRRKGEADGRQTIVSLTQRGRELQTKLADVPFAVGNAVVCDSVNPATAPDLFRMLDDIIAKLNNPQTT
jgi:DNA-binding MarR family transcriptional regulator